jgi:hypothetical protein
MIDWLIDYFRFYIPLKNFSLMETSPLSVKGAKFRPMLGAQGLWAGRDLYCATPAVTRDLGFSALIRRTAPFSRLLRHTRGCGGSILSRNLTGESTNYYTRWPYIMAYNPDIRKEWLTIYIQCRVIKGVLSLSTCAWDNLQVQHS